MLKKRFAYTVQKDVTNTSGMTVNKTIQIIIIVISKIIKAPEKTGHNVAWFDVALSYLQITV